jgi:hypothetical protein
MVPQSKQSPELDHPPPAFALAEQRLLLDRSRRRRGDSEGSRSLLHVTGLLWSHVHNKDCSERACQKFSSECDPGSTAHDSWARFSRRYPSTASRYRHLETFHTSGRGITNGGQQTRDEGVRHVIDTYIQARSGLQG